LRDQEEGRLLTCQRDQIGVSHMGILISSDIRAKY
jgi:hypothetical protein